MTYDEINKPLSRTSFGSKMALAFSASTETMSINGQAEVEMLRTRFLPDEFEAFVLNSVVTKEYSDREMTKALFIDVMNAIRAYQPPEYYEKLKTDHLKWVLPTIGAVQFEPQQYLPFKLFRHHCLFTFANECVDVNKEFMDMFGSGFDEYAAIAYTFHALLSQKDYKLLSNYWDRISLIAPWFIEHLKLTREQYKNELNQFAHSSADYKYCLRPSYSYPFIEYENAVFLPTPHLLIQSITTAMMNRLTFGNDGLREKIGKHAFEGYLRKIICDSCLFDEIIPEYEYVKGKKTLDILTRKGNIALLIDSKMFSPKVALRTYDERAYQKDAARIVKEMKQAYLHAHDRFDHEYNPFSSAVEEVYALIVVYQEGYLDLGEIYRQTAQELSINEGTEEFTWLCQHVGFTEIANIERFLLTKTDIIPEMMDRKVISDKWLTGWNGTEITEEANKYHDKLLSDVESLLCSLHR